MILTICFISSTYACISQIIGVSWAGRSSIHCSSVLPSTYSMIRTCAFSPDGIVSYKTVGSNPISFRVRADFVFPKVIWHCLCLQRLQLSIGIVFRTPKSPWSDVVVHLQIPVEVGKGDEGRLNDLQDDPA